MSAALRAEFERCRAWLEPAVQAGGETSADAVFAHILAGRAQLWPGEACAVVTQCVLAPSGPAIHAWLGGGKLAEMIGLRSGIEAFGRAMGCAWATIDGRRGWARLYGPFGYEADQGGVLRKRL